MRKLTQSTLNGLPAYLQIPKSLLLVRRETSGLALVHDQAHVSLGQDSDVVLVPQDLLDSSNISPQSSGTPEPAYKLETERLRRSEPKGVKDTDCVICGCILECCPHQWKDRQNCPLATLLPMPLFHPNPWHVYASCPGTVPICTLRSSWVQNRCFKWSAGMSERTSGPKSDHMSQHCRLHGRTNECLNTCQQGLHNTVQNISQPL